MGWAVPAAAERSIRAERASGQGGWTAANGATCRPAEARLRRGEQPAACERQIRTGSAGMASPPLEAANAFREGRGGGYFLVGENRASAAAYV